MNGEDGGVKGTDIKSDQPLRMDSNHNVSNRVISIVKAGDHTHDHSDDGALMTLNHGSFEILDPQADSVEELLGSYLSCTFDNAVNSATDNSRDIESEKSQTVLIKHASTVKNSRVMSYIDTQYEEVSNSDQYSCRFVNEQNSGHVYANITGSSCSSPPFTPPYSEASLGLSVTVPNLNYDDSATSNSGFEIHNFPTFCPTLGDWEAAGDPTAFSYQPGTDGSLQLQISYSAIRNKKHVVIINVGDTILVRRHTQEWFDRWPLTMKILSITYSSSKNDGCLSVKMRRYFGIFQVSCMLPNIALEMANREAVVFSSDVIESLTPDCVFVEGGLVLSLLEYYRFWAEVTRMRHGRFQRRRLMETAIREEWQEWLNRPNSVFVLCGQYDPIGRTLESVSGP